MAKGISGGTVHTLPADLRRALTSKPKALATWEDITQIARNEWICWVESVKTEVTRNKHIERAVADLADGERRPCCWYGCIHRTDKPVSPSVRAVVLNKQSKKRLPKVS
jgi:Bacteriocin-protection, YdeI or OmpD-Associated